MSLKDLTLAFSPPVAQLFQAMIPSFQEGYAGYVYQTKNPDTQKRRIKQLEKTFKKLLVEPYYYLQELDQTDTYYWKKELQLELLDIRQEALSNSYRKKQELQIIRNGACIGLAVLGYLGNSVELSMDLQKSFLDQLPVVYKHLEQELQKDSELTEVNLLLTAPQKDRQADYQGIGFVLLQNDHPQWPIRLVKFLGQSI